MQQPANGIVNLLRGCRVGLRSLRNDIAFLDDFMISHESSAGPKNLPKTCCQNGF